MDTRREALKIIGAVGVTCSFPFSANELYGQHTHQYEQQSSEENVGRGVEPRFFNEEQFEVISRLTDLIIPTTDTPGAVAAGVPAYIDLVVKNDPKLQLVFKKGLQNLHAMTTSKFGSNSFLQLSEAHQVEILTLLSEAAGRSKQKNKHNRSQEIPFFAAIKGLTADGYYTSRIGLLQELGYNGDAVLASFPEFSIPEH